MNLKNSKKIEITGINYVDPNDNQKKVQQKFNTYTYWDNFDEVKKYRNEIEQKQKGCQCGRKLGDNDERD